MNGSVTPPAATPGTAPLQAGAEHLPLRFTASGSEYFRIWSVNALLVLLTLGFYLPFAKARRLRYFHANTLVGGDALAFHGDPWKMFRGYLVMFGLFAVYSGASYLSELAALLALAAMALVWPVLWRSSLVFRLGNTSWRGLRFAFEGSLAGAYRAQAMLFLPGIAWVAATTLSSTGQARPGQAGTLAAIGLGVGVLVALFTVPLGLAWVKRYQHGGYRYGPQAARLAASTGSFYGLLLKLGLLALVATVGVGAAAALLLTLVGGLWRHPDSGRNVALMLALLLMSASFFLVFSWVSSLAVAWMQNLVWGGTQAQGLRFTSSVSGRALAGLSVKNLLLVVLTLGLYRPFAVVNTLRMRLESVSVTVDGSAHAWLAGPASQPGGARGEMAGEFFGIDVGL